MRMSRRAALACGRGGAALKDVNFYDFNGTLLYSYWLSELPLAELPDAPDHSGDEVPLTFQQWSHTLARVNACRGRLDVGATNIPSDGKTRLVIEITAAGQLTVPLCISQTVANGVSVDWGDGSAAETIAGTGYVNTTHNYTSVGRYDIALTVATGCILGLGSGTNDYCVIGPIGNVNSVYRNMLREAYIGARVTGINFEAFHGCEALAFAVIPQGVTSIGNHAFESCYSLASVTIPQGVTRISNGTFSLCTSLTSVVIPAGITSIGDSAFSKCYALASVNIPQGVTSIGSSTFSACSGMAIYDFSACTSVPTLASTTAFFMFPDDCVMLIPSALFASWSAATNWVTYAGHMTAVWQGGAV